MKRLRSIGPERALLGAALAFSALFFAGCASVNLPQDTVSSDAPRVTVDAVARAPIEATKPLARASGAAIAPEPLSAIVEAPPARAAKPDASLWDRIRGGFAMSPLDSPLVAEKERFYRSKPEYLQRMFQRGGRYLYYIVEELERRNMPTELALLPFVESAMNPVAVSPAKAAGLWQFIPSTGKAYDLHQNWWVDNRRDPVKSTHAALDYLQKIYEMHGNDWYLALASYNWGEGAVARAVKKDQARGGPGDYLSIAMPAETRHYVPKLIALKNILLRADEYGIALPALPNRPYFVTIEKTRPIDLKLAAQFAGMSVDEFLKLNPAHNRPVIAASKNNQIKLPADRKQAFIEAAERHEQANKAFATWQPYTLQAGETLDSVARSAGASVAELREANSLRESQRIVAGTRILAPQKSVEDEMRVEHFVAPRVYEQIDKPAVYHTVGRRESVGTIAQQYGITAATLRAWNGIKASVKRGMRLLVQPAATQTLLTDEEGDRSIVASAPKAGIVKVSFKQPDQHAKRAESEPERAEKPAPAPRKRKVASRAPGRHEANARPAARAKVAAPTAARAVGRTAAKAGKIDVGGKASARPEARAKRAAGAPPARSAARDDRKASSRADSGNRNHGA